MDIVIDQEKNIAYIKLSGILSENLIKEAFNKTVYDKQYKKGIGRLWDFRKADLSGFNTEMIARMANYPTQFDEDIESVRVAFVMGRSLEYGLGRMFEAFSVNVKNEIKVFYEMDEAEKWMTEE